MKLNTFKCNYLTTLHFKGLITQNCSLTPISRAINLMLTDMTGCVVIRAPACDVTTISVNHRHLHSHSIEINHAPDRLRRSSRCYALISAIYKVVKSARRFANQSDPVTFLHANSTATLKF